jgi:hypothetical protein
MVAAKNAPTASAAGPGRSAAERACWSASVKARAVSALSRCSRVGKCRYKVPMPTPARSAISAIGTWLPRALISAAAAASSRSRLAWASLRGARRRVAGSVLTCQI